MDMNLNKIENAANIEQMTAVNTSIRFDDFRLRTLNKIQRAAMGGAYTTVKSLDVPYNILKTEQRLEKFVEELREHGYVAEVVRKRQHNGTVNRYLFIGWGAQGVKTLDEWFNSPDCDCYVESF